MMENIRLEAGSFVKITTRNLNRATYIKLQPEKSNFLDLENPRVVLEHKLRLYQNLTKGDLILVRHNNKDYRLKVPMPPLASFSNFRRLSLINNGILNLNIRFWRSNPMMKTTPCRSLRRM